MRSMTGYGQSTGEDARHRVAVSIRSVNHRGLDLVVRLRDEYRASEYDLRVLFGEFFLRGRIEVGVDVEPLGQRSALVEVQQEVVTALHDACRGLIEQGLLAGELTVRDLLGLPGVLRVQLAPDTWEVEDQNLLLRTARAAALAAVAARELEGAKLKTSIAERVEGIEAAHLLLAARRQEVQEALFAGLRRRLEELLGGSGVPPPTEERLVQEVAILVERSDIAEELDRLRAHLQHFRLVMEQDGSIGKRLDFLTQELARELNTLGAKSRDAAMTRTVLDAKGLCEQLREQVQNVE